ALGGGGEIDAGLIGLALQEKAPSLEAGELHAVGGDDGAEGLEQPGGGLRRALEVQLEPEQVMNGRRVGGLDFGGGVVGLETLQIGREIGDDGGIQLGILGDQSDLCAKGMQALEENGAGL